MSETARLTGPQAVPTGTEGNRVHYPAGWPSPEAAQAAQKAAVALEVAREQEEAAKAAREQAITDRIASRRVPFRAPGAAVVEGNSAVAGEGGKDEVKSSWSATKDEPVRM